MLSKFKIGHYTNRKQATGCTVIVPPLQNVASAAVGGASPGTRELALLSPERKISQIHALVLTGGSAFGLNCAHGVMESLVEAGIGYNTNYGLVPIVPAAVIFDKNIADHKAYPKMENGRSALDNATFENRRQGCIGAGTGATVGKWKGMDFAMKAGLGISEQQDGRLKVLAITVVNAATDILGKGGKLLAGAVDSQGHFFADSQPFILWDRPKIGMAENTILTTVLTNGIVSKQQAYYIATRAHHGIARRVEPSHTSYDGDIAFVISAPEVECNLDLLAQMAVGAVENSILNAIEAADSLQGVKALRDIT